MAQEVSDFFRYFVGAGRAAVEGQVIKGVGVSKGSVRARARVILELRDSDKLQPGEVLVCRTTSAPWSPLIAIAGGVVTDTGGLLSHSAIVAREYAIPCVTGTRSATTLIPDGATVTVDGEKGTVTLEG
jgi:pyruvate,water dikinase